MMKKSLVIGIFFITIFLFNIKGINASIVDTRNANAPTYFTPFGDETNTDIKPIEFCSVEDSNGVLKAFQVIGYIIYLIKLVVPLLLIILASIDFAKAVFSSSDKSNAEAVKSLIQRIIISVVIFIIPTILDFLLGLVDGASETFNETGFTNCTDCLLDPLGKCQAQDITP